MRPAKDQPFYHLLAENAESSYVAYVSQQNLVADDERRADRPSRRSARCSTVRRRALPLKPEHRLAVAESAVDRIAPTP
jgi:heat shock protein HspQ